MTTKTIQSVSYFYPNGVIKYVRFKNPLSIKERDVETVISSHDETGTIETISRSLRRSKNMIAHYCHANDFTHFCTLTLDPKVFEDRHDRTKSLELLRKWLKVQRQKWGKFDYIFIPEVHKNGGIHFHGVFKGYNGSITFAKKRKGREVYHLKEWSYGFTDVELISNIAKVSNYIRKYITKDMEYIFGKQKYIVSRGLKFPLVVHNLEGVNEDQLEQSYENEFSLTGYYKIS